MRFGRVTICRMLPGVSNRKTSEICAKKKKNISNKAKKPKNEKVIIDVIAMLY